MLYKEYDYILKGKVLFFGLGAFMAYLVPWFLDKAINNHPVKLKGVLLGEVGSQIFLWSMLLFCILATAGCIYAFIASFQKRKIIIQSGNISLPKTPLSKKIITINPQEIISKKIQKNKKILTFIAKTRTTTIRLPSSSLNSEHEFKEIVQFMSGQNAS